MNDDNVILVPIKKSDIHTHVYLLMFISIYLDSLLTCLHPLYLSTSAFLFPGLVFPFLDFYFPSLTSLALFLDFYSLGLLPLIYFLSSCTSYSLYLSSTHHLPSINYLQLFLVFLVLCESPQIFWFCAAVQTFTSQQQEVQMLL